ncbi:hypothetical protein OGATHE_004293 [Ogataea polymorpha]|uniref:Uncharacterized protein n=1 Tax=Ogataea polymorpha TaxID=460523 RepID=A0A9P8P017_9ASCO|nr:hypothetical protein OGATHE_004293 [Ogataea polymorpha]
MSSSMRSSSRPWGIHRKARMTPVSETVENAVEDDEERHDLGDFLVRAADNETNDKVATKTNAHGVFPSDSVREECADKQHRNADNREQQIPFRNLLQVRRVVQHRRDDGGREDTVRESDKVVDKPAAAGSQQSAPIILKREPIGHVLFDSSLLVEHGRGHLEPEVKHCERPDAAYSKHDSPGGGQMGTAAGGRVDYQEHDQGKRTTELGGSSGTGRVLSANTKPGNTSCNDHHPKHALGSDAVGGSRQNGSHHNHQGGGENGPFSAKVVSGNAHHDLSQHSSNEQCVGDPSLHRAVVRLGILEGKHRVQHVHTVVLVPVRQQGRTGTDNGEDVTKRLLFGESGGSALFIVRHHMRSRVEGLHLDLDRF